MNVFRPKRQHNGKSVVVSRYYRGRYRLPGELNWTEVALHVSDKEVAMQELRKLVQRLEREALGVGTPKAMQAAAANGLHEHLERHLANMRGARCSAEHVYTTEKRLAKLFRECGWMRLRDITADSFEAWRARNVAKSAKTVNEFLCAARTFLKGLVRKGALESDPLALVKKIDAKGKQTRQRRAFTDDEVRRLLNVAGPRQVVYLMAVHTGIRRGELAQLVWGDLVFDRQKRYVRVRASTAKNHRDAIISLCDELAAVLQSIKPAMAGNGDRVFEAVPSMHQFRADLAVAGIEYRNQQGLLADFHALRHTFITNMARGGVAPRVAMELARHSEMNLTMNVYTTTNLLPTAAAVQKLPHYCEILPQILPHATGANGQELVHTDMNCQHGDTYQEPANIGESHVLAETGTVGHDVELAASLGLEPTVNCKPVLAETVPLPQILPHATGPSDLQEVISAWDSLAEPIKAAVLAVIRSAQGGKL